MTIEAYKIIDETEDIRLEEKVNKFIKKGWIPQGGISVDSAPGGVWYYQAMVKMADNP